MQNCIVVTDKNRGLYGALLDQQFRQRHALFVRKLGWDIPHTETIEADQYDRVDTVYVLIERDGNLVGYARLVQTTSFAQFGRATFSFMVKDASLGLLPGLPANIVRPDDIPTEQWCWEITRVEALDRWALEAIFETASTHLRSIGARSTITFTRMSFLSILNHLGYHTEVIGPEISYAGKGYCVLKTYL